MDHKTYLGLAVRPVEGVYCTATWRWDGQTLRSGYALAKDQQAALDTLATDGEAEIRLGRFRLCYDPIRQGYLPEAWPHGHLEPYLDEQLAQDVRWLRELEQDGTGLAMAAAHRAQLRASQLDHDPPVHAPRGPLGSDAVPVLAMAFAACRQAVRRGTESVHLWETASPQELKEAVEDPYWSLRSRSLASSSSSSESSILDPGF